MSGDRTLEDEFSDEMTVPTSGTGFVAKDLLGGDLAPSRLVRDPYPNFHGIVVDPDTNLVVMSDSNSKSLLVYDRASGDSSDGVTRPLRQIAGPATGLMFIAGVILDVVRQEIYTVANDIGDRITVFSSDAHGNVRPKRVLNVPHQAWGISLNPSRDEIAVTVEKSNMVVIYRREAKGGEAPLRIIRGAKTELEDPHGVYFDQINNEIIVANHGNKATGREYLSNWKDSFFRLDFTPEPYTGGHFYPPSITVHQGTARGDTEPLRIIQGSQTRLNWPMGLDVDPVHDEIAIANNGNNSVLIFRRTDEGDVAPVRMIHGAGIDHPVGVAIDSKNDEIWVTNYNNHSAVVFPRTANGNVAPRRIIRNAPVGTPTGGFGNPGAIAYDSRREEILVPS